MTPLAMNTRPPRLDYKTQVNVRLTHEARNYLALLATQRGISQADVLEIIIREEAIRMGLKKGKLSGQ